jgi:hypothetical protein
MAFAAKISSSEIKRNPRVKASIDEIRRMIAILKENIRSEKMKKSAWEIYGAVAMVK